MDSVDYKVSQRTRKTHFPLIPYQIQFQFLVSQSFRKPLKIRSEKPRVVTCGYENLLPLCRWTWKKSWKPWPLSCHWAISSLQCKMYSSCDSIVDRLGLCVFRYFSPWAIFFPGGMPLHVYSFSFFKIAVNYWPSQFL